jgi:hypothetical protein
VIDYQKPQAVDWPQVFSEIRERWACMNPGRVADITGASRSAIYLLCQGRTKQPTYSVGAAILALHEQRKS